MRKPCHPLLRHRLLACALVLVAATRWAAAQDVELYDGADFSGTRLTVYTATPDLAPYGLGARVSSLVINRGAWEFCTQPLFRGACVTVGPGRYNRLPMALNDNLASLRPVAGGAPQPVTPPGARPDFRPEARPDIRPDTRPDARPEGRFEPGGGRPAIVLYAGNFAGPELRLSDAVVDLAARGFNDTATSVDVMSGTWDLCSEGGFGGQCLRFTPGRYSLPPALRDRLSSLRPVPGPRPSGGAGAFGRPWAGASPAIVFHEDRDFGGRDLPLVAAAPDFAALGFNDRASSVEIVRGRWQLCRGADFQGCVVFGPGRYVLDGRLHDAVSSARPVWGRDDRPLRSSGGVTLHDSLDLRGNTLFVDRERRSLRDLRFNNRVVAIEVHGGEWELCSQSELRGRCLVFGPGWHRLPDGLAGQVSSLRPR